MMFADAATIDFTTDAAFTPKTVIVESAERVPSSFSAPQKTAFPRWKSPKHALSANTDFSIVEQEVIDRFAQEMLRTLTETDVETVRDRLAVSKLIALEKQTLSVHSRIRTRIQDLKEIGEDEGIAFNHESEADLLRFLKRLSFINKPSLFLLDNGNLRAVWKGDAGQQVGLQFLGKGQVQFVIFSKRDNADRISRIRGRDDFDGIARHMGASAASEIVYA